MLLSVIIPQYKESDSVVRRLLSTIDYQVNVEWDKIEVIVVNDGSDVLLSDEMLDSFENIKPKYIKLTKNIGPGLCRQAGLDLCCGDYVTFCDADDMYFNFGAFEVYIDCILKQRPDIIRTQWLEENKYSLPQTVSGYRQKSVYIRHDFDNTWLHGKCIRRQFLIDNKIRFSDKLWYHEDSYFLSNCIAVTDRIIDIDFITYIWKDTPNSITRRNNSAYTWESLPEFIYSITLSMDWIKQNNPTILPTKIVQLCLYIYYILQSNDWEEQYTEPIEKNLCIAINKFKKEFNSLDNYCFTDLNLNEQERLRGVPYIIKETFTDWIHRILKKHAIEETSV